MTPSNLNKIKSKKDRNENIWLIYGHGIGERGKIQLGKLFNIRRHGGDWQIFHLQSAIDGRAGFQYSGYSVTLDVRVPLVHMTYAVGETKSP